MLWSSVAGNIYGGLLLTGFGCVLLSLHQNPCWNIRNSTSPRFPEDCREHLGNLRSLEYHMMLAVWKLLLGSQQSVLEAGCALFTTSPSTELVFETDFFWFLQMFEVVYTRMWILKESQPCQSVQLSSSIGPYSCLVCKETQCQWGLHHIKQNFVSLSTEFLK